ncbi:MAG: LapA family protein [Pseudanabaena sp.]
MTRSPFAAKSQTNKSKKDAGTLPIVPLIILGIGIIVIAVVVIQNFQPVQIFFLGQKTIPLPLSMAMLIAFVIGGLIAFVCNAIASWQQNIAIRRAIVAAGYDKEPQKEQIKSTASPNRNSQDQSRPQNEQYFEDDELDDELDEDEYDEDELKEEEDFYEEEEDVDPDTVPYGDRKNLKSAKPNREKPDRSPLEARYIR